MIPHTARFTNLNSGCPEYHRNSTMFRKIASSPVPNTQAAKALFHPPISPISPPLPPSACSSLPPPLPPPLLPPLPSLAAGSSSLRRLLERGSAVEETAPCVPESAPPPALGSRSRCILPGKVRHSTMRPRRRQARSAGAFSSSRYTRTTLSESAGFLCRRRSRGVTL